VSERVTLVHGRVSLALHCLRAGDGRPLLRLHGLGEHTPGDVPAELAGWPGPVWGLDFTGHGASTVPRGGGYTAEILLADADTALASLGSATVVGRGIGAYVALLLAGARPAQVRGAMLCDGPGLIGGGPSPTSQSIPPDPGNPNPESNRAPDPWALLELSRDVRPPDYAAAFVREATHLSGLDAPIIVCARLRPEWLAAVAADPGVVEASLADALDLCAAP
jgi:pimeloyl-ACP methyl ester carboxylesterase